MVCFLLSKKANINLQTTNGSTPLMVATENQYTEIVLALLESGANLNLQNNQGLSCLMIAAILGYRELHDLFIERGALINLTDQGGKSALMHAVFNQHTEIGLRQLELGAQVDVQDNNGWSPLMYAAKAEDMETVQILLAYRASIHLKNFYRHTIFDVCSTEMLNSPLFQNLVSICKSVYKRHNLHILFCYFSIISTLTM